MQSEKQVMHHVKAVLALHGYFVDDMSQPRRSMMPIGLPDIYARHPSRRIRLWVECKAGRNKPTEAQEDWHAVERAAGGLVFVVRSGDEMHRCIVDLHERLDRQPRGAMA